VGAVDAVDRFGDDEIEVEQALLAQLLQPARQDRFAQLPPQRPLFAEPEVLRELLRDGGGAAPEMALLHGGGQRDPRLLLVDPVVLEEAGILAVDHGPDQPDGNLVHRHPVLVVPAGAPVLLRPLQPRLHHRRGGRVPVPQRRGRRQREEEQPDQASGTEQDQGSPVGGLARAYVESHRVEYKRDPLAVSFTIRRLLGVLRDNRDFRTLYAANAVSQLGDWFNVVALFSLLLELTAQPASPA